MHEYTLAELSLGLARGDFSSRELTSHFLGRINQYSDLNAFITVTPELALAQADAADAQRRRGEAGPLTGVPIAHKDIFCTQGHRTTCASRMLDNFMAPYDATVIARSQAAGMVMLGKTNMDEFAMGSSCENSFYGPSRNPWDVERIPGGSSGGSATAVAARLAPVATGTDTGGSIRQPAALCGLTGLKPTYGRVSRFGMIAFASSLDQAGPMTYTAEDAALLMNVMAGHDPKDSTSVARDCPDFTAELSRDIKGLKIGLPKEYFIEGIDPEVRAAVEAAMAVYRSLGAEFVDISLPHTSVASSAYYIIAPAECSANLARFDGVRYGYRCDDPADLADLYQRSRGEGFGREVKRRIVIGTYVLCSGYYDAYYVKAQQIRRAIAQDFTAAFESVDVILTPTTPTPAFRFGEKTADPVAMYLSDVFTVAANLAGLPALSMPAGFSSAGLPVGVQLIGSLFGESRLLNVAHQYQQHTSWHKQVPPEYA